MTPDPKQLAAQAQDLKARGRLGEAIELYRQAASAAPASIAAAHNLAAALGDAGRWAEAEPHIRRAVATPAPAAESLLVLARCLQSRGALDEAEDTFLHALARRPDFQEAHFDLAQLRWMRTGETGAATKAIEEAIARTPTDVGLRVVRARILENTGQLTEAYAQARALASAHPDILAVAILAAQLATAAGDDDEALAHAERAKAIAPHDRVASVALITALLGAGAPARAEAHAVQLLQQAPTDQHAIALLATAWRMLGDPRSDALHDYDALVRSFTLDTPPGWRDLSHYLGDLASALKTRHVMRTHPFDQSIRRGSQIPDILRINDPAIRALPQALDGPIGRYIAALGAGRDPVRNRNLGGYAVQGMWSIRMQAGGSHIDHVHPNGWISSACYLELPEGRSGTEGWIRFGAPGIRTTPALEAERFIEPKPGMVVLFPSYLWHGVLPYAAPGARMTLAFDLEPAPRA